VAGRRDARAIAFTGTPPRLALPPTFGGTALAAAKGVDRSAFRRRGVFIVAGLVLALGALAAPASPASDQTPPLTADRVLASLNHALAWYQQARVAMQAVDEGSGFADTREDRQTAVAIVQRAFDVAKAQAAAVATEPSAAAGETAGEREDDPAALDARIKQEDGELARLTAAAKAASAARRAEMQREAAAARNRLELDRARADFVGRLKQLDDALPAAPADLGHQIDALRDGVPELRGPGTPAPAPAPARTEAVTGTWPLIHRLLALAHARSTLGTLGEATDAQARAVDADLQTTQAELRPVFARLRALAQHPGAGGDLAADEREFHGDLERAKRLAGAVVPARQERALLRRYAADLREWQRAVESQATQVVRGIMVELFHVAVAVAVILVGAALWRFAVVRYVGDAYRRHLLLTARNVVVGAAVVLVIAFHFTTELATLVTALGFAAAGIAFALQTIILALAGYFAIVAPNGIRVGDRVSLQGPFSWVYGEVVEIGFLRIKLRELTGDPPAPTGRIVVFPNSVVFTGSFFKHPAPATSRAA
jgi:hypothetical protein